MDTRYKLRETEYFLERLIVNEDDPEQFSFNLSAFLSAWRSVLDIMLYDFALIFFEGLSRDDYLSPGYFKIAAKAQKHTEALSFIDWFNKKRRILEKNSLWKMRHIIVHRGYPLEVFHIVVAVESASSASSVITMDSELLPRGAIPTEMYVDRVFSAVPTLETKVTELIEKCREAYALMVSIVEEAENEFDVKL